jgi:hypothetical protein
MELVQPNQKELSFREIFFITDYRRMMSRLQILYSQNHNPNIYIPLKCLKILFFVEIKD